MMRLHHFIETMTFVGERDHQNGAIASFQIRCVLDIIKI